MEAPSPAKLKAMRTAARISQHALSRRAGVDQSSLSRYERNLAPLTPAMVERVASALKELLAANQGGEHAKLKSV